MKIYISGPMTGLPENNYPAFHAAARKLRAEGHAVINPAEIHPHGRLRRLLHRVLRVLRLVRGKQLAPTWADYMRADIRALLDCEAIALLPGWEQSRGARCEVSIAEELGMRRVEIGVKQVCEWCGGQRAIDVLCRHTYAEREREMLIGFREAVRRIAAKPIDSSDMMDEIEHLLSLPPNKVI